MIYTHLIHAYMNLQVYRKPTQIGVENIKHQDDMFLMFKTHEMKIM